MIVRNSVSLVQAASALKVPITSSEAETISRRKSYQQLLRSARNRYFNEIGSDPAITKIVLIGKLLLLADRLTEEGSFDKASEVLFKIAKIRGDVGAETQTNVFADLSARDYADIRKSLEKPIERAN